MKKEVVQLNIKDINTGRNQSRIDLYDEKIESLAESIKDTGLLQPVLVRKVEDHYELVSGERRYLACRLNGYESIDAIIVDLNDEESARLVLEENLQRQDLNAIEQAMAMKAIMKNEDLTQGELAERLGYKQSTVANKLRLLKLPEYVQRAIAHNTITERHARALLNVPEEKIEEVFLTITNKKYNVSKTEEYIKGLLSNDTHRKGVSGNVKIGLNTLKQSYELCRKSGIDADMKVTEYDDEIKIVIRMKK
ncbi:MAG: ParB/RepB/Spo0J family partition protein [Erysipelotrichaceae bacterium]|nr:ParB/RepB/Spo0J family partition protein [Erysipelotrichaceae bacterium]